MKREFKTLPIIVALGLLGVVAVMWSVEAKQTPGDVPAQGAPPSFPARAVTVAEGTVAWGSSAGEDIDYVKPDSVGVFFVKDSALETIRNGTATWSGFGPGQGDGGHVFNLADGTVSTTPTATFTLDAVHYDTTTPANTPIAAKPFVTVGGVPVLATDFDHPPGTLTLFTDAASTTVVTFRYHVRDMWDGADARLRRARVTSTSDVEGEYATLWEVASFVAGLATTSNETSTPSAATAKITVLNAPIVDADGDVDGNDIIALTDDGADIKGNVTSVDPSAGEIGLSEAVGSGLVVAVSYQHAAPSPTSQMFRGDVLLTSDAAAQGTNGDGVWVQDGDTLTVTYLSATGTAVAIDTVTVDGVAPTSASPTPETPVPMTSTVTPTRTATPQPTQVTVSVIIAAPGPTDTPTPQPTPTPIPEPTPTPLPPPTVTPTPRVTPPDAEGGVLSIVQPASQARVELPEHGVTLTIPARAQGKTLQVSPNPPMDRDGRREGSGRG